MKTINRTAITIRPKQPYIDWAKSFDDGEKYDPGKQQPNKLRLILMTG
ncbi:MAG: hypothetical protein HN417_05405 [Desulfobacula sp.]|nr:hypothetical protein [Desulfobacula sp.]MBT6339036.1 hypothetical protein [Desulfobacula sp.]MBT7794869.1 hypothetical protein [Desulfobacula sp.]